MHIRRRDLLSRVAFLACALLVLSATFAAANEIQLAGVRLGQHALHLLQVYGQPDGTIKGGEAGGGSAAAAPQQQEGGGMPGMGGGMEGGMMPGMGGGMEGGMPGMGGGMEGGMPGMGGGAAAGAGGAAPTGGGGSASAMGGAVGGAPPGPFSFFRAGVPNWAGPVWIPLLPQETLWVYRKGSVVMGFALDRDGYVVGIAVAGNKCDWARTAMWDPKRSIKLSDSFDEIIKRYGYPDRYDGYQRNDVSFLGQGQGPSVGGIGNAHRDLIMHYGHDDNVEFLLRDMKVVRIHIWEPEARGPETRGGGAAPAGGAGMGGAGMDGGMPGMGGGMPGMPGMGPG